jgi:pilus assembly protein CpaC
MKRMLVLLLLVVMVLPPQVWAQQVVAARAANAIGDITTERVDLLVGRSTVIKMDRPITRVSLSTPDIADAMVTTPYEVLVHGKTPGTISLLVWADNGRMKTYDVAVKRDLSALEAQVHKLFPGEAIDVSSNGKDVVLSGVVSSKYIVERASSLALGYVEKAENVQNLIRQQEGVATNQIMLRVRFAEVSRNAMQELGVSFFTGPNGKGDWLGRSTTQQYPAPAFDQDKGLVFSDFLNLFFFNTEEQLGAVVKALKGKGLFQSLAEPNLITQDGKEATFLAGGEYPYPVMQGSANNAAVTIVFKEFGIRLRFTPTVTADEMIQLKVAPEVSSLDFGNAILLNGFRVPSLATRRTETSVELRDGQTFAIAGMLDQNANETLRRVPGIGDIPILGYLFRSQAYEKHSTELVVMITPHIVRRNSPGVTPNLPGLVTPFLESDANKRIAPPPPAFSTVSELQQIEAQKAAALAPAAPKATAQSVSAGEPNVARPTAPAAAGTPAAAVSPQVVEKKPVVDKKALEAEKKFAAKVAEAEKKAAAVAAEQAKVAAEQARKDAQRKAEEDRKQSELQHKQDEIAAQQAKVESKAEAERVAKEIDNLNRIKKAENDRLTAEQKEAEKRAVEQAAIDRKRFEAEQAEAERLKEAADKLAKEKAARDAELARLVEQYKKLTANSK